MFQSAFQLSARPLMRSRSDKRHVHFSTTLRRFGNIFAAREAKAARARSFKKNWRPGEGAHETETRCGGKKEGKGETGGHCGEALGFVVAPQQRVERSGEEARAGYAPRVKKLRATGPYSPWVLRRIELQSMLRAYIHATHTLVAHLQTHTRVHAMHVARVAARRERGGKASRKVNRDARDTWRNERGRDTWMRERGERERERERQDDGQRVRVTEKG